MTYHRPVMVAEVMRLLKVTSGMTVVDATVGGGGHAKALLEAIIPGGELIGIDRDQDAINECLESFTGAGFRVRLIHGRMGEIRRLLVEAGVGLVDAIIADLGVSGFQLDRAARGFSFNNEGPLDMRMDASGGKTAAEFIMETSETELGRIIKEYGEERFAGRIARNIKRKGLIMTTRALTNAVIEALPSCARRGRIHPATRTFQALRIAVNDELGELDNFLRDAPQMLKTGGRLAVLSYHSLEDRKVKQLFRTLAGQGDFSLPVKRPVRPEESEIRANPRSRSAKLRVIERVG